MADRQPPAISLRGVPRKYCTSHRFRLRARVRDDSTLRRVAVYLDGRQVRASRASRVRLLVRADRLRPGRHRLSVTARDSVGNLARVSRSFRRCPAGR